MSLPFLVLIVVAGISLVIAAVHFTGGSARAALKDEAHALDIFRHDYPDIPVAGADLALDRQTAFLRLPGGAIGIVHTVGDGFLTRQVEAADVAAIGHRDATTISVRFRDFTWRGGDFAFADPEAAQRLADALDPDRAKIKAGA